MPAYSSSTEKRLDPKTEAIIDLITKVRMVQGWGLQSPEDARLMSTSWVEQLDRYNIRYEIYPILVDLAVDRRSRQLRKGEMVSPLTVELLIACYGDYRDRIHREKQEKQTEVDHYRNLRHRVDAGELDPELALEQLGAVSGEPDVDFSEIVDSIILKLQREVDTYLDDHYIS